jgi:hypothetical protein
MPSVRETYFIDYAAVDELSDIFLTNRALVQSSPSGTLASYLIEGEFLNRHADSPVLFRVDRAIVDTVKAIRHHTNEDQLTAEAIPHLRRLPRLCQAYWQCSPYYALLESEAEDESLDTAIRLFREIEVNIDKLLSTIPTTTRDPHMRALTAEEMEALAQRPARAPIS